jgi:Fibronectin type III domain
MPMRRTRSPRLASAAAACAAFLAACSGGGGGGVASGGAAAPSGLGAASTTTSITLAWVDANGPVAGYSVYVQREDGAFKHEADVTASSVTLHGEPGSTARVTVAAFDASRGYGPSSPTSPEFMFPNLDGSTSASMTQSTGSASGVVASGGGSGATSDPGSGSAPSPTPDPTEEPALPGTLVWQADEAFLLTNTALATTRFFARPEEGAQLAGMADFDGDGRGDLLWVRAGAELGYTSGSTLRSVSDPIQLVDLGALAVDERVLGAGDFDGDGDGDVLVASGDAVRARLTAASAAPTVNELGTASQAVLAGIADFDANGSEDIAWRSSTGGLVLWLMDRGSLAASVEVALPEVLDPIGTGDFDGNGNTEIALRSSDGTVFVVHPLVAQPQLEATDLAADASLWAPGGDADLDADGSDELVLVTAGAIRIASLPGDQMLSLGSGSPWRLAALLP